MADNIALPATGVNALTDDCTTGHAQIVKLAISTDGSATLIPADATNGIDVDVTRLSALVAGSAVIGKVGIDQTTPGTTNAVQLLAGTANIGDVDVLTVPAPLSTTGTGTEATALRVTIATDSTGVLSVDDNNSSITVDAPVGTPAFVRLSDGASAITTLPVSLASVPSHAVTNAGTFATQAAGDVAHGSNDSGAPLKTGAKAIAGLSTATVVTAAQRTDLYASTDGALIVRPYCGLEDIVTGAPAGNTSGASFEVIAAGAAGIKHYLTQVVIINTSTASIYCDILDGSTIKTRVPVPAQGGATVTFPVPIPGTAATAWNCDPSAATTTVYCSAVAFKSKV